MSKQPKKRASGATSAAAVTALGLLATSALFFLLGRGASYKPFFLAALFALLPAVINLLLLAWRGRNSVPREGEATGEATQDTHGRARASVWRRVGGAIGGFFLRHRTKCLTLLIVAAMAVANLFFWRVMRETVTSSLLSFYMAVVLLVGALLLLILSKWCKHATPRVREGEQNGQDTAARYEVALLRNLQTAAILAALVLICSALTVALRTLGIYDFSRVYAVVLAVVMLYQTVFFTISLFVVLVRHEMGKAPEIMAPVPGVRYANLGVLGYLEENTGISMRSLWSIRMIGQVFPYAILLSLLLLWCATGIVVVGSQQKGAHYHFGRLQEAPLEPGLHMTLPWPFDEVRVYDTETIGKMTIGYITEKTGDNLWTETHGSEEYRLLVGGGKELVSVNLRVEYRIGDLHSYLTCTGAPELLLGATSYEIVTNHMLKADLDTLLSVDRTVFSAQFKEELVGEMARYGTGLEIVSVALESIHPPVDVAQAYQAFNSAHINAERMIIDAKAYAFERLAWAQISYDTAEALARIDRAQAVADAEAALAEFMASVEADRENTDAYRYYKYLEALTGAYEGAKLIIVGDGIDQSNIYIGNIGK